MRLNIPALGTKLTLTFPWVAVVSREYRNASLRQMYPDLLPDPAERGSTAWYYGPPVDEILPGMVAQFPEVASYLAAEQRGSGLTPYVQFVRELPQVVIDVLYGSAWQKAWDVERARLMNLQDITVVFPAGTVLIVDRIYIRRGANDFDSVTFRLDSLPGQPKIKKARFWVKLDNANTIEYE